MNSIAICVATVLTLAVAPAARAEVPSNGLIGYWTGNNTAADQSPTQNDGVFNGSYAQGVFGGAFNLATGKVYVPDNAAYDLQSYAGWTIGFWFHGAGTYIGQDIGPGETPKWFINYGYGDAGEGRPDNSYILHLNDYDADPREFLFTSPQPYPSGWTHLALAREGGAISFFVNGALVDSVAYAGIIPDVPADLVFGNAEPCCQYDGLLDNITIYNRALSAAEVELLATIPEPQTWGLMIAGFGLTGAAMRRRRVTAAVV